MKLSLDDRAVVDHAKQQLNNLQVEIKAIDGFLTQYLGIKYQLKTAEEVQALINDQLSDEDDGKNHGFELITNEKSAEE